MASPTCEVKDGGGAYTATTNGVNVTSGNVITIRLASVTDVNTWSLTCVGTDDGTSTTAINALLTVDNATKTATFTMPASASGRALMFQSRINGGVDVNGTSQSTYTTTFGVYVLTSSSLRLLAYNETTEGSASYGWVKTLNEKIRQTSTTPTGTGFVHITAGSQDAAAKLVENADVHASAAIAGSKISPSFGAQAVSTTSTTTTAGLINSGGLRQAPTIVTEAASPYSLTSAVQCLAVNHGAAFTANLPTSPTVGDEFEVMDYACAAATYNITVDAGGGHIIRYNTSAGAQTFVIPTNGAVFRFRCIAIGASNIWKVL